MRTRNVRIIGLLAVAALVAALGSALAAEGDDGEASDTIAVSAADEELLDGLLALESELPEPVPSDAELAANELDGVLQGSITSARSTLDRLEDDLRQLFVQADDAGTAAGDAVAQVARGFLLERQALMVLEAADNSTNPRPLDSSDARNEAGIAIDADGELGQTSIGIDVLLAARDSQRAGYALLQTLPEGTDGVDVFAARHDELVSYEDEVGQVLRVLTSAPTDELLVPAERYDAPVGVARATSVTYVCVDREAYLALTDVSQAERVAASLEESPSAACQEAARRAGLSLADQEAALDAGIPTSGADTADDDSADDGA